MGSYWRKKVRKMPDKETLKAIKEQGLDQPPVKRKRGRPKGSRNKPGVNKAAITLIDPKTGLTVSDTGQNSVVMGRMGDERVTAFVQYHIDMLRMREGVNKKDVPDLYRRFYTYLAYCAEHGIIPGSMNAYFAIGVVKQEISAWKAGQRSPEHQKFAEDVTQFFASIHEQGGAEAIVNPILSIYWSKAHDGMVEASKLEVVNTDPLGDKKSAAEIAERYSEVNLPD